MHAAIIADPDARLTDEAFWQNPSVVLTRRKDRAQRILFCLLDELGGARTHIDLDQYGEDLNGSGLSCMHFAIYAMYALLVCNRMRSNFLSANSGPELFRKI